MSPTLSIPMVPVPGSSNVAAIGYDANAQVLAVRFNNGGLYHYRTVNPEVYHQMLTAESKGSFIAKHIRPHYACERIVETTPGATAPAPAGQEA